VSDHDHDHDHPTPDALARRTEALESLLVERGFVTPDAIDRIVERFERDVGPMIGARVVARAWVDPEFRRLLTTDAHAALAALGITDRMAEQIVVLQNEPGVHHVVVCTLCSCYPWALLGLPPTWYKDFAYRSRVVREPRAVLREMGLELGPEVEVRVFDSSAELRYLVLPERPRGTEAMSEAELAALVTRDSMIGVARAREPGDG
jgi:nitrile hydratase